jgi:hypothetical protein
MVLGRIFFFVKVRQIARPIKNFELALHILQPLHDELAGVARGAVLEEELGPMGPHEWQQVVLQKNGLVSFTIHSTVFGQEIQASSPSFPTETTPCHHAGTVLYGGDGVPLFVARDATESPDLDPPGVFQAESGLI